MLEANPQADADNVEIEWLFHGEVLGISRYRCRVQHPGLAHEQAQRWHVIAFPHRRAFLLHEEGSPCVIDPTDVIFVNAGVPYRTSHPFGYGDWGSALVLRPDALIEAVAVHDPHVRDRPHRPFPFRRAPSPSPLYLAVRLLAREITEGATDESAVIEAAFTLAGRALAAGFRGPRRSAGRRPDAADRIEAARHEIARTYDRPRPLVELARVAELSLYHFCRTFREHTGLTVHRYHNRLRLRAAVERLADGPIDLSALAHALGFSSHSHFTAAFRAEFGVTPDRVRDPRRLPELRAQLSASTAIS
jgi:AraC family transcriptional regulator